MKHFVFGANGYVGNYLYNRFNEDQEDVVGTSTHTTEEYSYYNIKENAVLDIGMKSNTDDKVAIICIAKANISECYIHFQNAYDVNVVGMKRLIKALLESGFYIIYFSTDCVFDGISGNYTEESERHPINKYGEMKAEMEEYILNNDLPVAVFRISRVVSPRPAAKNPFSQLENWAKNGVVQCIKDNYLSYVSVEDIYQICKIAAEKKMYGLYNLCGDEIYSRKELAQKYFDKTNQYDIEIVEIDVNEFGFIDSRPLNVSMSNYKIRNVTGYKFTVMDKVIEQYLRNC